MTKHKHFLRIFFVCLTLLFSGQTYIFAQEEEEILAIKSIQLSDVSKHGRVINKPGASNDVEPYVNALRSVAQIFINRENYIQPQRYLNEALETINRTGKCKSQKPFIYYSYAVIHARLEEYEKCLEYANKCLADCPHQRTRIEAQAQKAIALYYLKEYKEFERVYASLQRDKNSKKLLKGRVDVMHYILNHNFRNAHSACNTIMYKDIKLEMLILTCQAETRYAEAMRYLKELEEYNDMHLQEIRKRDMEEAKAALGLEQRESENEKMKLKQTQLDIANQTMLREKSVAEEKAAKLANEQNELLIEREKLQHDKENKAAKINEQNRLVEMMKAQDRSELMSRGIYTLIIIIFGLILYIIHRYFASKKIRKHNIQLEIARKLVEESDKTKTVFLQNVSHEIRTPLNAILGFSQILTCQDFPLEDEEKREYSRLVRENSEQLTTLITDIFLLSDLDCGKVTITEGQFRCNQLCREAIDEVKAKVQEGVDIVFDTDIDEDFTLNIDGDHLKLILTNLLTNSVKYTNAGRIRLTADKTADGDVAFAVEDTGTGIPKDKSEQVFERFEKLGSYVPGNGLGLSISRAIGKLMDLELKMDTAYEGGSRFTLKRFAAAMITLFLCFGATFAQNAREKEYISAHDNIIALVKSSDSTAVNRALDKAYALQKKASKENYPFGMLSSYRTLACIYLEHFNYHESLRVLDEAEEYLNRAKCQSNFYSIVYYERARNYDLLDKAQECLDNASKAMANPFSRKTRVLSHNLYVRSLYKLQRKDDFLREYDKLINDEAYSDYLTPGRAEIYYNIITGNYAEAHELAKNKETYLTRLETEMEVLKAEKNYKQALDSALRLKTIKTRQRAAISHRDLVHFFANLRSEIIRLDSLGVSNTASALLLQQAKLELDKQQIETEAETARAASSNLRKEQERLMRKNAELERQEKEKQNKIKEEQATQLLRHLFSLIIMLIIAVIIVLIITYRAIKVRRQLNIQQKELQEALEKAEESDRLKTAFMGNLNVNLSEQLNEVNTASKELFSMPEPPEEKRFKLANKVFDAASDMMKVVNDVLTYSQKAAMQEFAKKDTSMEFAI